MISNTVSTPLVYSIEYIRVKVYIGKKMNYTPDKGTQAMVSVGVRNAPSDAFLAGALQITSLLIYSHQQEKRRHDRMESK